MQDTPVFDARFKTNFGLLVAGSPYAGSYIYLPHICAINSLRVRDNCLISPILSLPR